MSFEPKILSFLCNWCAYAGADLAGISRFQYPPRTRVIRMMCTGRVDPSFIPRALLGGFDGVMILGCHPGDCHYLTGNIQAEKKIRIVRKLLSRIGVEDGRLYLDWVSAGEGQRFARVIQQFTAQIENLGPFPLTPEMEGKLLAVQSTLEGEKTRWMTGKIPELLEGDNVYGERVDHHRLEEALETTFREELIKNRILGILGDQTLAAAEISAALALKLKDTLPFLVSLVGEGKIGFDPKEEGRIPRYVRG